MCLLLQPVCARLWCMPPDVQHELHQKGYKSDGPQGCRTQHMPWADGTPCGSGSWCHKGKFFFVFFFR